MIKSTLLQSEFARRFNRINSGSKRYISPPEVDSFLNEAYLLFFENRASLYKTSVLARKELGILEEKEIPLTLQSFNDLSVYGEIPTNFYKLLRVEAKAKCDSCPEIRIKASEVKNHEIYEALTDVNWTPSYNYAETYFEISGNKLIVYHNNAFELTEVNIDYLRKPKPIHTPSLAYNGSYIDGSGNLVSTDSNLEIDDYRKIVDLAVLIASRDITDTQEYESQLSKILQTETIYIQ